MTLSSTKGILELLEVGHHEDAFGEHVANIMGGVKNKVPEFHGREYIVVHTKRMLCWCH